MAKRQAIATTGGGEMIPRDLIAFNKDRTDAYDDFVRLLPIQNGSFTVTTSQYKITLDLPNLKTLRMNQIYLEIALTPGFTSTSGSDTFASILPQFVGLITCVIDRVTIWVGSGTFCDLYTNDLRNSLQYWLCSNP